MSIFWTFGEWFEKSTYDSFGLLDIHILFYIFFSSVAIEQVFY